MPKGPKVEKRPADCVGIRELRVEGRPDPKHVSTSFVERQNLTMRMSMRRFTRLTNGFSKKAANHAHMVALHTQHRSLRAEFCSPKLHGWPQHIENSAFWKVLVAA